MDLDSESLHSGYVFGVEPGKRYQVHVMATIFEEAHPPARMNVPAIGEITDSHLS
jgi:hypothetical protein